MSNQIYETVSKMYVQANIREFKKINVEQLYFKKTISTSFRIQCPKYNRASLIYWTYSYLRRVCHVSTHQWHEAWPSMS